MINLQQTEVTHVIVVGSCKSNVKFYHLEESQIHKLDLDLANQG